MTARTLQRGSLLDVPAPRAGLEEFDVLLDRPGARLERIVSAGSATPAGEWYDQPGEEWVALLSGRATLRFEAEGLVELTAGAWVLIPAHARHRVEATSDDPPCVWLAVHLPADPPG